MNLEKIDTHAHILTPSYKKALVENGHTFPDGNPSYLVPEWSVEAHLNFMQENNISKSILSTSSPGTHLVKGNDALARRITRECNEYAADLKIRYPEQLGFWASLPLPDVEGAIDEIDHALDKLNADGFIVFSNSQGIYLGDNILQPVFKKLNERKAKVFIHPTTPCNRHTPPQPIIDERNRISAPLADCYINPLMEFFFDTTRSLVDLLLSGTASCYKDITFIVAHAGAALPALLSRMVLFSKFHPSSSHFPSRPNITPCTTEEVRRLLSRQFFFDLAGDVMDHQIHAILRIVGTDRLLYGSDFPWTPGAAATELANELNRGMPTLFNERQVDEIFRVNAQRLLKTGERGGGGP
ncbi:amidohydrolase 2 [Rickenella mellea]|uniref:6-methylsalicylate decarboxylase n=1 Tax=Rickenella mellea TaxID=50990 RepID=A0A4Y7Q4F7_9AGAM|nr:amidohydrolase 2 [Rickenella mellea]